MSRKNNLLKFQNITNGDMSQATLTSAVTEIQFLDNIGIQANFTGSPVGVFAVQVSADYARDLSGVVQNPGNWITISSGTAVDGSPIYFDINQTSAPYIRLLYTRTSGSGTLNSFITAKML